MFANQRAEFLKQSTTSMTTRTRTRTASTSTIIFSGFSLSGLIEMRIDDGADQAIQGRGQPAENRVVKSRGALSTDDPLLCQSIELEILDYLLLRPPRQLEASQTIVFERRSAEM